MSILRGSSGEEMKILKKVCLLFLSVIIIMGYNLYEANAESNANSETLIQTTDLNLQSDITNVGNGNITMFIIGDSTSKSYHEHDMKTYPREGWGQEIFHSFQGQKNMIRNSIEVKGDSKATQYILPKINIESWGKSGATIKSCYESKRFDKMLSRVRAKDYVMIQFGHNDARKAWGETPKQYETYLTNMVKRIKAKKAIPVLVTSLPQYNAKKVKLNAPKYRAKMLRVSKMQKVQCIDLNQQCVKYFNMRGSKVTKKWYMFLKKNKYKSYPNGLSDNTHFRKLGASVVAKMVAVNIQNSNNLNALAQNLNFNSKSLYRTLNKAEKYKKKKLYKEKTWEKMERMRRQGWITLYSPNKGNGDYKRANDNLKKAIKGLKKR